MKPTSYLPTEEDLALVQFSYTFAIGSLWLENGMANKIATFDLFVRDMPAHRNFLLAGGLEEVLNHLENLHFTENQIAYLKEVGLITDTFADYLRSFRFSGTIYAVPEGTVVFPYEPIIRVTAPIIEACLVEIYLMSAVTSNTTFLSKAARLMIASKNKFTVATGPIRAHGFESAFKACRAAHLCGMSGGANPVINKKYGIDSHGFLIIGQHLFMTSYPDELTAMRELAENFPNHAGFMVDTYDFEKGIENTLTVCKELAHKGQTLGSLYIDSGDVASRARYARTKLDEAGFTSVKIIVAGNLDEYRIAELADADVPCDMAGSLTEFLTLSDSPKLEIVYKLAETRLDDAITYAAKLTPGKVSYPGKKQIYRTIENGTLKRDILGLEGEDLPGVPLLQEVMSNTVVTYTIPTLDETRAYIAAQLSQLPENLKDLFQDQTYDVQPSTKLSALLEEVRSAKLQPSL